MATRTPPRHGERRCYLRGCRRPECAAANYQYMSRYRLDREHGQRRRIDSTPACDRVHELLAAGWNQRQIADAANCSERAISEAAQRIHPTMPRTTLQQILAIDPGQPVPQPLQYADATGSRRRLQALLVIGHPARDIAAAVGLNAGPLVLIARGIRQQVRPNTRERITAIYPAWTRAPGTCDRTRTWAQKYGWHGPLAWDSNTIDDPNAQPDADDATVIELKRDELAIHRAEEIEHLARFGVTHAEIARRVGVSEKYVREHLAGRRRPGWRQAAA